jgi:hypothetical protein
VFHDQATSRDPQDVSGRFFKITINPTNAIFNLQGILGHGAINEFKFGYNAAPSTEGADTQAGFENIALSLQGTVANAGIAGQGSASSWASPGGLVRVNSAGNGRGAPYNPYSLTFADSVRKVLSSHYIKFGGDARLIRMSTDQLGGITYLSKRHGVPCESTDVDSVPSAISAAEPVPQRAHGLKHIKREHSSPLRRTSGACGRTSHSTTASATTTTCPCRKRTTGSSSSTSTPA